ncbi:hypothetical protein [Legionella waltersii]|uniref:Ankyrin repeat-containing protein n=1 Tax=Legionella waltersii TaxID=66969 RepID=A0A0W1AB29_9GAMM|nr:hypothetical protein [Legionella waltersii]KTD78484.1 ankyrin repeat-containing protein [Legionella waltersii]SNV05826.1 ankyrin repeat-containing protein [Legionella waltersii]
MTVDKTLLPTDKPIHRDQCRLIRVLNKYLESQDLPVRMDIEGVCQGLSALRCKYVLAGRENEYYEMLDKLTSSKKLSSSSFMEVNHFIVEVLVAYMPDLFDVRKEQKDSLSNLSIDYKQLSASLELCMITTDKDWELIFDEINLQKDEAMLLTVLGHAVSVSRPPNAEGYRLADPNEPKGYVDYPDAESLIAALHKIAEYCNLKGDLGLTIELVRHPNAEPRTSSLPSIEDIYDRYSSKSAQFTRIDSNKKEVDCGQLEFACRRDNIEVVKCVIDKLKPMPKEIVLGLITALKSNNSQVADYLLSIPLAKHFKLKDIAPEDSINMYFDITFDTGHYKCFEMLLTHNKFQDYYLNQLLTKENALNIIHKVANSANPELLQTLLNDLTVKATPPLTNDEIAEVILTKQDNTDAIEKAIGKKGRCGLSNTECVEALVKKVFSSTNQPSDEQLLNYTLLAMKSNQPHLVNLFIDTIKERLPQDRQEHLFKSIYLSTGTAKRTDYSVLKALDQAGCNLSIGVKAIMKEKEGKAPGILLSIGTHLSNFSDWLEGINRSNNMSYCKEKFNAFKQKISGHKEVSNEVSSVEQNIHSVEIKVN